MIDSYLYIHYGISVECSKKRWCNLKLKLFFVCVAVRIIDIAGWTDTWFAKIGRLFNIAVLSRKWGETNKPFRGIEIIARRVPMCPDQIVIKAADIYYDTLLTRSDILKEEFDTTNLLQAVLSLFNLKNLKGCWELTLSSPFQPGASVGTSAAVAVALIKILCQLPGIQKKYSNSEVAWLAFIAETEVMGGESGTQDQFAAAYSCGANYYKVGKKQKTTVFPIKVARWIYTMLERRLMTVFVGQHNSSETHEIVIKELKSDAKNTRLKGFIGLAKRARKALRKGNLAEIGSIMIENTNVQKTLHPDLVGPLHQSVIDLALHYGCIGYKVNGAGGKGGSVTLLFRSRRAACTFYRCAVKQLPPGFIYYEHKIAT